MNNFAQKILSLRIGNHSLHVTLFSLITGRYPGNVYKKPQKCDSVDKKKKDRDQLVGSNSQQKMNE